MRSIIDFHCHVYPEKIADRAVENIKHFYELDNMHGDGKASSLIESGEKFGVKHFVVFSVATAPHQVHSINSFIARTVKEYDGLMTGFGTLHPESENLEADFYELLSLGLKGVKLHPDFQRFQLDDPRCDKIFSLCEGKLPVIIHAGDSRFDYSNPERIENILKKHEKLTLIAAHFGGWSCWKQAAERLCRYTNLYVDCSSTFRWLSVGEVEELISIYGADRVLFGTDYPMWGYETELTDFEKLCLSDGDKDKILCGNAKKLLSEFL